MGQQTRSPCLLPERPAQATIPHYRPSRGNTCRPRFCPSLTSTPRAPRGDRPRLHRWLQRRDQRRRSRRGHRRSESGSRGIRAASLSKGLRWRSRFSTFCVHSHRDDLPASSKARQSRISTWLMLARGGRSPVSRRMARRLSTRWTHSCAGWCSTVTGFTPDISDHDRADRSAGRPRRVNRTIAPSVRPGIGPSHMVREGCGRRRGGAAAELSRTASRGSMERHRAGGRLRGRRGAARPQCADCRCGLYRAHLGQGAAFAAKRVCVPAIRQRTPRLHAESSRGISAMEPAAITDAALPIARRATAARLMDWRREIRRRLGEDERHDPDG